jgi:hypothetical protein
MKAGHVRLLAVVVVWLAGLACKKSSPSPPQAAQPPLPPRVLDAGVAIARAAASPELVRAQVERDIRAVIEKWVSAQNRGDFATYAALYEQTHFRGLKRTKGGKTVRSDWAAWRDDRAKMFDKGAMTVAVKDVAIRSWLDKTSGLRPGVAEARFVQRWRNPRYADHGTKVLQFLRGKDSMTILYEDMLTSTPGWQEVSAADGGAVDGGGGFELGDGVAAPKNDDEAMALWKRLGITYATVDAATSAVADLAGADIMAEALLRHGDFVCKRYAYYGECSGSGAEWEKIPANAGWDDPCVQREAAVWAIGQVNAKRLPALADVWRKLASLPWPEQMILDALVERFSEMPEKLKLELARAMLDTQCDGDKCDNWQPDKAMAALTTGSRLALYRDSKLELTARQAAINGADLSRAPDALVEVYGDDALEPKVRQGFWSDLMMQKPAVLERALRAAADDKNCPFAMAAIEKLAERGKRDLAPRAGRDESERVVCLLLNATDQEWAEREFRKLLPKRGKIEVEEEMEDEADGVGGEKRTSEHEIPVGRMRLRSLPEAAGWHTGRVEYYYNGPRETVELLFDENGLLQTVAKTSWSGCPC